MIVVWMHTGISIGFVRWVIPTYYTLSGFFLFGKILNNREKSTNTLVTWLRKTLRLYLIWTIIYIPFAIIGPQQDGLPTLKAIAIWFRNILFVGENYLSWPLWYLLGLLQAGVIIWLAEKLKFPLWIYPLFAMGLWLLPHIIPLNDIHFFTTVFKHTRNGFFIGFPYMVLGGVIKYCFPQLKGWDTDNRYYTSAIILRFFSIHIYLSHMLWAGCLMLSFSMPRSISLWVITCTIALITGFVLLPFPKIQRFLYGRAYLNRL